MFYYNYHEVVILQWLICMGILVVIVHEWFSVIVELSSGQLSGQVEKLSGSVG